MQTDKEYAEIKAYWIEQGASARLAHCLANEFIKDVASVVEWSHQSLRRIPNLGSRSLIELQAIVQASGFAFREPPPHGRAPPSVEMKVEMAKRLLNDTGFVIVPASLAAIAETVGDPKARAAAEKEVRKTAERRRRSARHVSRVLEHALAAIEAYEAIADICGGAPSQVHPDPSRAQDEVTERSQYEGDMRTSPSDTAKS